MLPRRWHGRTARALGLWLVLAVAMAVIAGSRPAMGDSGETPESVLAPQPTLREREAQFETALRAYDAGDYATAFAQWLPLARLGDPAAQRNVGHLYRQGLGVTQDFAQAANWYRRAAEAGLAQAQANLAMMYLRGQGVPQDAALAAQWFVDAALQGHPRAQYNIGLMYFRGVGVERNEAIAAGWLYLAGKAGHEPALSALGQLVPVLSGPQGPPPPAPGAPTLSEIAPAAVGPPLPASKPAGGDAGAPPSRAVAATAATAMAGLADETDQANDRSLMTRFLALFAEPDENMGMQIERLPATAVRPPAGEPTPAAGRPHPVSFDDDEIAAFLRRVLGGGAPATALPAESRTQPPAPEANEPP